MTGSGRPLYRNTFSLSLVFFSHHLRSQYTIPGQKASLACSLGEYFCSLAASRLQYSLTDLCLPLRYAKIPHSIAEGRKHKIDSFHEGASFGIDFCSNVIINDDMLLHHFIDYST
jgi:hypothetical protein